jgi:hypothetical protein
VTPETRPETLRGTGSRTRRTATRATGRATRSRTGTRVGRGEILLTLLRFSRVLVGGVGGNGAAAP